MATAKVIQLVRRFTGSVITPGTIKYATDYDVNAASSGVAEIDEDTFELRVDGNVNSVKIDVTFGNDDLTGTTPMIAIKRNTVGSNIGPANLDGWNILKLTDKPVISGHMVTYTLPIPKSSDLTTPTSLALGCGICAYYIAVPTFSQSDIYL